MQGSMALSKATAELAIREFYIEKVEEIEEFRLLDEKEAEEQAWYDDELFLTMTFLIRQTTMISNTMMPVATSTMSQSR